MAKTADEELLELQIETIKLTEKVGRLIRELKGMLERRRENKCQKEFIQEPKK